MVTAPQPSRPDFIRIPILLGGRTVVESTCTRCGKQIVGTVIDGLPRREADHLEDEHGITAAA